VYLEAIERFIQQGMQVSF